MDTEIDMDYVDFDEMPVKVTKKSVNRHVLFRYVEELRRRILQVQSLTSDDIRKMRALYSIKTDSAEL
jgi:hypothetical protein